jgi:2-keto-4-pentenoate hydratase
MQEPLDPGAPAMLAACRRAGTVCALRLDRLAGRDAAEAFQKAALDALGGEACGYKIGATSVEVQRLVGCGAPFFSPILRGHVLESGVAFAIPAGLLGVECEFGFVMGRDVAHADDASDTGLLQSAVAECFVGLELVGRRIAPEVPLNEASAIADYALDVAVVRGPQIPDWRSRALDAMPVRAVVDGVTVARGTGANVLGHPLRALAWLAESLAERGGRLSHGDIVLTGTCTGIAKVAPGQTFAGHFADLSPVEVRLV